MIPWITRGFKLFTNEKLFAFLGFLFFLKRDDQIDRPNYGASILNSREYATKLETVLTFLYVFYHMFIFFTFCMVCSSGGTGGAEGRECSS